jgi:hypothetical protein
VIFLPQAPEELGPWSGAITPSWKPVSVLKYDSLKGLKIRMKRQNIEDF